ncbi:tetratricopeptide repeat protein [Prochlorococcus sp. MIT 1303]|uniref:tetratricopeptide repeat protein n=1 Tax=Prochlorococcus sp. MIT 1303 TaxID=1723647 RepID=UPI0007BC4235|nr:tetratricopeptide repeat protein [Prochlorococcus sp. MIT 1303]KZR62047.1 lipoprotein NlpI [Prochlorococcus sp. MIT 1303]
MRSILKFCSLFLLAQGAIGISSSLPGFAGSPCNKKAWSQALVKCGGSNQCAFNYYFSRVGLDIKGAMQCKLDDYNRATGKNYTLEDMEKMNPLKNVKPSSSCGMTLSGERVCTKSKSEDSSRSSPASQFDPSATRKYNEELKKYNEALSIDKAIAANPQGAIAYHSKEITINPKNVDAYVNRGLAKENLKDYKGAIADHSKAIAINPQHAPAYYSRGVGKHASKDYQGAIADYSKAITINPYHANAYSNRAIAVFLLSNDSSSACSDIKKAASLGNEYRIDWLKSEDGAWCRNMR